MADAWDRNGLWRSVRPTDQSLQRLQLEMAFGAQRTGARPIADKIAEAAKAAGAGLLFVLPAPHGIGSVAVVRLIEAGLDSFLEVDVSEDGVTVKEQADMDQALLQLARASVDVLGRLADDDHIREPLQAAE